MLFTAINMHVHKSHLLQHLLVGGGVHVGIIRGSVGHHGLCIYGWWYIVADERLCVSHRWSIFGMLPTIFLQMVVCMGVAELHMVR